MSVDELKNELQKTKSQKKRRRIIEQFNEEGLEENDRFRLSLLKEKANRKRPAAKAILIWGALLYIPCWILLLGLTFGTEAGRSILNDSYQMKSLIDFFILIVIFISCTWTIIAPFAELVLLVIVLKLRMSDKYYLNIKSV
ncbi:MAG: hypothetical protein LUE96_00400 [Lachnospiraceae bacterium]|nr:hypothetical protein [Lachnospiraceae bacterium]